MKRLVLIRHAKSSWKHPDLTDHDRPLNRRGRNNLGPMRQQLRRLGITVEQVFSSSANRALTTAKALAEVLSPGQSVEVSPELYQFDSQPLWHFIQQAPVEFSSLALVGHNPAMEELAERLLQQPITHLPTCAVLELELQINDWQALYPGCAELSSSLSPKQLE